MATARLIRLAYDAVFADLDLNLTQASLLLFVDDNGPQRQTDLARRLGLGRAAAGVTVDQLERRGLVERQPDPDDRRAWRVTMTPEGKELVGPLLEIDRVFRARLRDGIPRSDRQQLAQLLVRVQDNLADILADER